jgi:DNA (cytosine-5)-methyltransferase 1
LTGLSGKGGEKKVSLSHIDLFSGIGGFALAAKWAGFKTEVFCEKDEYCQRVLCKRFGTLIADTEHDGFVATKGKYSGNEQDTRGQEEQEGTQQPEGSNTQSRIPIIPDIFDFDGTKWRGATLLTGGFPCQPFSQAGQRRGTEDDRHLWPEMLRVIAEARPRWVLGENVAGIINMELDTVLADLEGEGYEVGTVVLPAAALNAPHRRDRVWIIAHSIGAGTRRDNGTTHNKKGRTSESGREGIRQANWAIGTGGPSTANQDATDSECLGWEEGTWERTEYEKQVSERQDVRNVDTEGDASEQDRGESESWYENWHEVATKFCRVDDGISNRVDRLKSLGNAIVPQIAAEIMRRMN